MGSYQEGSRAFQFLPRSTQDMAPLSSGTRDVPPNGRCDDRAEFKHESRPCWMAGRHAGLGSSVSDGVRDWLVDWTIY